MKDVHLKLRMRSLDGEQTVEGVVFNVLEDGDDPKALDEVDVIYRLDVNRFRNRENLQLMIEHISPVGELAPQARPTEKPEHKTEAGKPKSSRRASIVVPF